MPLTVTDYTWTQSESTVYISVPLKGIKTINVDVICTDEYLKVSLTHTKYVKQWRAEERQLAEANLCCFVDFQVSFPPFLFEAFLFGQIDEEKSEAKIGNGVAVFTLQKKKHEVWEKLFTTMGKRCTQMLCYNIGGDDDEWCILFCEDKDRQRQVREQAIVKVQTKADEKCKAKAARIQQEKKFALETMMKVCVLLHYVRIGL